MKLGSTPGANADLQFTRAAKKDSGSARQGETANTATCDYPNRLNLTHLTARVPESFEIFRLIARKFWRL